MPLETITLTSSSGEYTRPAWYLAGTQPPRKIAIFLDAEYYLNRMGAAATLTRLQTAGNIPPLACLFISHLNGEARHSDYICNPLYAEFISHDAVKWVQEHAGITASHGHLIAGTSLSGLQAAFTTLTYPDVFSSALCHSGSFWWQKEWLKNQLTGLPTSSSKFWLSVGNKEHGAGACHSPTGLYQEVDQGVAVGRFTDALSQQGHQVYHHLYEGGHDTNPWKEELPDALEWLLKG